MLFSIACSFGFTPPLSSRSVVVARRAAPVRALTESEYLVEQQRAQKWYARHSSVLAEIVADSSADEMPPILSEWGCDEQLWAKIRSKRILLEWARDGEEAKARERIELLRNAPSVVAPPAAASPSKPKRQNSSLEYTRDGDLNLEVDAEKVDEMLRERMQHKLKRDFDAADAIREELKGMGIDVNDKRKTWKVRTERTKARAKKAPRAPRAPVEMPAKLAELGCDAELWAAIHSKDALLKLVEQGNDEYARRRIERMRELTAAAGDAE